MKARKRHGERECTLKVISSDFDSISTGWEEGAQTGHRQGMVPQQHQRCNVTWLQKLVNELYDRKDQDDPISLRCGRDCQSVMAAPVPIQASSVDFLRL